MNKIISAAMVISVIALATSCSETKIEEHRNEWDFTDWTENDGEINFKLWNVK